MKKGRASSGVCCRWLSWRVFRLVSSPGCAATATPYLHFYSPEPGTGKTTGLDEPVLAAATIEADNLTEAVLFWMIDKEHPTLGSSMRSTRTTRL